MIAWLHGKVVSKSFESVVVDVGGVGYELLVSLRTLEALPGPGGECTAYVHTHVREDAILLFGFSDAGAKRLFVELTTVNGIGPKIALNALSMFGADELRRTIVEGDHKKLSRISGVGPKTAQRIVLELGQKLRGIDIGGSGTTETAPRGAAVDDLGEALVGLGYSRRDADSVVEKLGPAARDGASLEELLRQALALLRS
ncbi:MAG: Holliday junction branch migration protein RuvA [Myxococcales bacterium]|nr:Holliday junction branch migration protein RuvA [Myxococcales bacterium]MCB9533430.1 Holliday junction branch migration protein RuvA [Myxococcales bacterium]